MSETINSNANVHHSAQSEGEGGEFGRLVWLMFAIFFVVALVTRLLPRGWRPLASPDHTNQSVYQEAMQAAHNVVPFVFINY